MKQMKMRTAILKAADSIEASPQLFAFESIVCPDAGCGTPGCALGWIGFHANAPKRDYIYNSSGSQISGYPFIGDLADPIGVTDQEFYSRMEDFNDYWSSDAVQCAKAMRQYADKFHPPKYEPVEYEYAVGAAIPKSVLDIFNPAEPEYAEEN
jgi:hypothetical protein